MNGPQVIHMVSAAIGAEEFYSLENHTSRTEDIELARKRDKACADAWVGHPNVDVVDNQSDFYTKIRNLTELTYFSTRSILNIKEILESFFTSPQS